MQFQNKLLSGLLVLVIVILCVVMPTAPVKADSPLDEYVPGELIVKFSKPLNQLPLLGPILTQVGISRTPLAQLGSLPIYRLRITNGAPAPLVAQALTQALVNTLLRNTVVYAEPNYIGSTPEDKGRSSWARGGDEQGYHAQWAPGIMRLPQAHVVTRGAGVTVAVLDTGVDLDHPVLVGHLVAGFDFVDLDSDPSEEHAAGNEAAYGHGTHVSGLVALAAPDAKIMPLRILNPDGSGSVWVLAEALRYVATSDVDVVNLSYSFRLNTASSLISDMLGQLSSSVSSPVIIAAAGNSGPSTAQEYPAAQKTPNMLAVAASTETDTLAAFSTRGSWVDLAAPGEGILSSVPDNTYGAWSGTSMAAPLTAGTAALVRAAYPALNSAAVASRLVSTGAVINASVSKRLDAAAALGLP